jgi:putative hydroxymethylpyrimidine transport system substrate-binding protein
MARLGLGVPEGRWLRTAFGALCAAVLLLGCGRGGATGSEGTGGSHPPDAKSRAPLQRSVAITIDWYLDGDHAGIVMADSRGFFTRSGVAVSIHRPVIPLRPLVYVNEGVVDLGISSETEVLLARARGVPVVAIGKLLTRPVTSMIWLPHSGIHDASDLGGRTIATAGVPYEKAMVEAVLAHAGVPASSVAIHTVSYEQVQELARGRADAIFANPAVAVPELEARGLQPVVVPVTKLGIPRYDQLVVVAREDRLRKEPKSIRKFMAVLAHGTAFAKSHPRAAAQAVDHLSELPSKTAKASVRRALPALTEHPRISLRQWRRFAVWMRAQGMLQKIPDVGAALTNAYLPSPPGGP